MAIDEMIPEEKQREASTPHVLSPEEIHKVKEMEADKQKKVIDGETIIK